MVPFAFDVLVSVSSETQTFEKNVDSKYHHTFPTNVVTAKAGASLIDTTTYFFFLSPSKLVNMKHVCKVSAPIYILSEYMFVKAKKNYSYHGKYICFFSRHLQCSVYRISVLFQCGH